MKIDIKRLLNQFLTVVFTLILVACGSSGEETNLSDGYVNDAPTGTENGEAVEAVVGLGANEWVYVPEYIEPGEIERSGNFIQFKGDYLYYQNSEYDEELQKEMLYLCSYSLLDGSVKSTPLNMAGNVRLMDFVAAEDGSFYALVEENKDSRFRYYLKKYDAQGNEVFSQDLTDRLYENDLYPDELAVDSEGRIYLSCFSQVWLFHADGSYQGMVNLASGMYGTISAIGVSKEGKVYVCCQGDNSCDLVEINYDSRSIGDAYQELAGGKALLSGVDHDFLTYDSEGIYEYDMATQTSRRLFSWLDSDINSTYVRNIGVADDGRIVVVMSEIGTRMTSLALMTKMPGDQVVQKETIVVGTISASMELREAVVNFNRTSNRYRVALKEYTDGSVERANSAWSDAVVNLTNDIVSGDCPDVIDLSGLNVEQMAAKGVFEDMFTWLDRSSVLSRDNLVESVVAGWTYDGRLVGVPRIFSLQIVMGRAQDVGAEMGWSLYDMIALADKYPDIPLFDGLSRGEMLEICMMYNESAFVDLISGECRLDSDEFKAVLEFVKRYPQEKPAVNQFAATSRIMNREVLLAEITIDDFDRLQLYNEVFGGSATCIGYPTVDGDSAGFSILARNIFAIAAKSSNKEGAWEFIESYLTTEESIYSNGFPVVISLLEEKIDAAVNAEIQYLTDENGNYSLDKNGDPIVIGHRTSPEEVAQILAMMELARPAMSDDDVVMAIISEEAEAFFQGQKSVDKVVGIIQNRVELYLQEQMD